MKRDLLITGCGRSGTKYIAILLKTMGIDVRHERRMGEDGMSSWLFAVRSACVPWGPVPKQVEFENVFHLVRNPLLAIPSITTFKKGAWKYVSDYIPISTSDSNLLRSAKYWLHWNELVEKRTDVRLKIEDMPGALQIICGRIEKPFNLSAKTQLPLDLNTRRYGKLFHIYETQCLKLGLISHNNLLKKFISNRKTPLQTITWFDLDRLDSLFSTQNI